MRIRGRLDGLTARAALPRYRDIRGQSPVFGSNGHRWRTERQTPEALRDIEAFLGTELPLEFRRFLSTIGSGAGPHYGVWAPQDIRQEVQLDRHGCAEDRIEPPHSERPLPITVTQVRDTLAPVHPHPLDEAAEWWPATYPDFTGLEGKPVYFLDWYEAWLDHCETALGIPAW